MMGTKKRLLTSIAVLLFSALAIGLAQSQDAGLRVVTDGSTGARVALPGTLTIEKRTKLGTNWSSPDGRVNVDLLAFPPGKPLKNVYTSLRAIRGRTLTRDELRPDAFVLTGKDSDGSLFHVEGRAKDNDVRGLSIVCDALRKDDAQKLFDAISTSFEPYPASGPDVAQLSGTSDGRLESGATRVQAVERVEIAQPRATPDTVSVVLNTNMDVVEASLSAAVFSPHDRFLATFEPELSETIRVWDIAAARSFRSLRPFPYVTAVAFLPDGQTLASAHKDGSIRIWRLDTGEVTTTLDVVRDKESARMAGNSIQSLWIDKAGKRLVAGETFGIVRIWSLETRSLVGSWQLPFKERLILARLSNDASRLVAASLETEAILDLSTGKAVSSRTEEDQAAIADARRRAKKEFDWPLPEEGTKLLATNGKGTLAAAIDGSGLLQILGKGSGPATMKDIGFDTADVELVMSPQGRAIAISSKVTAGGDDKLRLTVFDLDTLSPRSVDAPYGDSATVLDVAANGNMVLANLGNGEFGLVSMKGGSVGPRFRDDSAPGQGELLLFPDGKRLLSRGESLRVMNGTDGSVLHELVVPELPTEDGDVRTPSIQSVALSNDSRFVAAGTFYPAAVIVWDAETGRQVGMLSTIDSAVFSVAFSPDGQRILFGTRDNDAYQWAWRRGTTKVDHTYPIDRERSGYTVVTSVASTRDGAIVVGGLAKRAGASHDIGNDTSIRVWNGRSARLERKLEGHESGISALTILQNERTLVSASWDGTVRYWDVTTGEMLATLVVGRDGSWLVLTPDGFFDASSPEAGSMLSVVRGLEVHGVDRVFDALYRPDLVREKIAGDPGGAVKTAAAKLDLDKVLASGPAPLVRIKAPLAGSSLDAAQVSAEAEIVDRGGGVGRVVWKVNGITQGADARALGRLEDSATPDGSTMRITRTLLMEPGANRIELVAYNAAGLIASTPAMVSVLLESLGDEAPPRLFVLAAGIDDYLDSRLRLTYSVPDARQVSTSLAEAGEGFYERVSVTTLVDRDVTADGLERAIVGLADKISPRDVFVFYVAGHGKTVDGRYYFLPRDFRYHTEASISDKGIGQDKWQAWFARIAARKSILIYDTCESGTLTAGTMQNVAMRSGLEQQAAIGRLINATGRTVLTAATSDRPALEGYQGHGVFTYALLDGLSRSDRNGNGLIEVTELAGFIDETVPQITESAFGLRQFPQMSLQGSDFALVRKLDSQPGPLRDGPKPASDVVSGKPTHIVVEQTEVFGESGGRGDVVEELQPYTAVVIIRSGEGWSLVARDGRQIGYVEDAKLRRLQ